jgi:hypothetical protein
MSFFKNLFFPGSTSAPGNSEAAASFGRYTDANKNEQQLKHWENAKKQFEGKNYIDAYFEFFHYLGDPSLNNVTVTRNGDSIDFSVKQGSKVVKGKATKEKVSAEVNVARFEKPSVAWMRKLMNMNFVLKYSRYAIKDDLVCMKFTTHTLDGSPTKLYWSLKELATNADKQDNLLTDEFGSLKAVDVEHVIPIPESEKEVKYTYLHKWISSTLAEIDKLDPDKFYGAVSYLLLTLTYRIDYLITPEGTLAHDMERIQALYFAQDNKSYQEKNTLIIEEYKKILEKPKEYVLNSLYRVNHTFGVVNASTHKDISDFILSESQNTQWYKDNNHPNIVLSVYEYINGYSLFNYGMYKASHELMHLLMQVIHQDYFTALGQKEKYADAAGKPDKLAIEMRIAVIVKKHKTEFPQLAVATEYINYNSLQDFAATLLNEISYLNFTK